MKLSDIIFHLKMKYFTPKTLLNDREIAWFIENENMIESIDEKFPLDYESQLQPNSFDLRIGTSCIRLDAPSSGIIDVRKPIKTMPLYSLLDPGFVTIDPGEFILLNTIEKFNIPNGMIGFVQGRSSIARMGLQTEQAGLVDAGFQGTITLELYNESPYPIRLYPGTRVAQIHFTTTNKSNRVYGKNMNSKYNGQIDATGSRIHHDIK